MADTRISSLSALTSWAASDLLVIVDVSDTTMSASGTTKYITRANLLSDVPNLTEDETVTGSWTFGVVNVVGGSTQAIHIEDNSGGATKSAAMRMNNDSWQLQRRAAGLGAWEANIVDIDITAPAHTLRAYSSGNVSIGGLTSADEVLHVGGNIKTDGALIVGANDAYVFAISLYARSNTTQTIGTSLATVNVWTVEFDDGPTHSAGVFTLEAGKRYLVELCLGWDETSGTAVGEIYAEIQGNLDSAGYSVASGGKLHGFSYQTGSGSLGGGAARAWIDASGASTSALMRVQIKRTGATAPDLVADACSLTILER